jgi:large subunit ribosomal protein L21
LTLAVRDPYPGLSVATSMTRDLSTCPRLRVSRAEHETRAREREPAVYAIVRAGGRQEKVAVGDVLEIDKVDAEPGASLTLPALLLVDDGQVTSDATALSKATVTVEVVEATKGPKITILKYKNKTGYRVRKGHRQKLTRVKVTGIENGKQA